MLRPTWSVRFAWFGAGDCPGPGQRLRGQHQGLVVTHRVLQAELQHLLLRVREVHHGLHHVPHPVRHCGLVDGRVTEALILPGWAGGGKTSHSCAGDSRDRHLLGLSPAVLGYSLLTEQLHQDLCPIFPNLLQNLSSCNTISLLNLLARYYLVPTRV